MYWKVVFIIIIAIFACKSNVDLYRNKLKLAKGYSKLIKDIIKPVKVVFCYETREKLSDIRVIGDFNDWNIERGYIMHYTNNKYKAEVMIPRGRFCYVFVVNKSIILNDPRAPIVKRGESYVSLINIK